MIDRRIGAPARSCPVYLTPAGGARATLLRRGLLSWVLKGELSKEIAFQAAETAYTKAQHLDQPGAQGPQVVGVVSEYQVLGCSPGAWARHFEPWVLRTAEREAAHS